MVGTFKTGIRSDESGNFTKLLIGHQETILGQSKINMIPQIFCHFKRKGPSPSPIVYAGGGAFKLREF